jgi:hypothetical protein
MKLNLIEWNRVVEALRIASEVSHDERNQPDITPAENKRHYVRAEQFTALADKIEVENRS